MAEPPKIVKSVNARRSNLPATLEKAGSARDIAREKADAGRSGWRYARDAVIWALLIFAAINFVLWKLAGEEKAAAREVSNGTGSVDLSVNEFTAIKKKPQLVLLGSSLVMYPFYAMDIELGRTYGDIFHHHQSFTLDAELKKLGYSDPSCYSLAIFGEMVSDAYILVNEFLKGDKAPDWLVFGIAPRDFSDYDLAAPMATPTFKRLVGLSNLERYASLYLPGWQNQAEFVLSHICYFYGKRWRLQHEFDKVLGKIYKMIGLTVSDRGAQSGESQGGFMFSGTAEQVWANSEREYRRRYRNIGEKDLSVQMGFLDRLLEICQERKIKVIVVNMPLTGVNRNLLPPGFYSRFRGEIKECVNRRHGRYLDLGDSDEFDRIDFCDTAHLNHLGGHKLVRHLVPMLSP